MENIKFKPYVSPETVMPEFTLRAIVIGAFFGIIFGASTVYLTLKAGLSVSASIPIAVLAISIGRKLFGTTILENNIIQTTGSAGESVAAGVVFTLPAFLFLSDDIGKPFFNYWTILMLAIFGGMLGVLMMIPLRRALIVKEHGNLPYPEGTACASVLIAGEKGGDFAKTAYYGLGFAFLYAILQKILHFIAEVPVLASKATNKFLPSAVVSGEITPEYMGVGYIIGPRISGVLVAGGILAWLAVIPLLATLLYNNQQIIADQLMKLGMFAKPDGSFRYGWDPATKQFGDLAEALYRAYIRQIGAGAVAAGGFITLLKTLPTIITTFKESIGGLKEKSTAAVSRTEQDLSFKTVLIGCAGLVILMALLPNIPGDNILSKLMLGVLVIVFGFFFVTVSSRIVGIIGSSNNPISGMTIATIMGTALVFIGVGWTGKVYEPMALVVGGMICIAAANAGATSQDLKTGYIVGATPKYQQMALFVGVIVSTLVIGFTLKYLDTPTAARMAEGIQHEIGEKFNAPQATLMATLIKGLLSFNLDWQFVLVGVFLAITMELCGVKSLSFAVGVYLPLSTTLPIFVGGAIKGLVEWNNERKGIKLTAEEEELGKGNLFATGLVAGGALAGVIVAFLMGSDATANALGKVNLEHGLSDAFGAGGYQILGAVCFAIMGLVLYKIAVVRKDETEVN